jgi:excisionase family DNA binding protein
MMGKENRVTKEYLSVAETSDYCGISERKLRDHLKNPVNPIPHFRVGTAGRIIRIKKSEFDSWMESQRATHDNELDELIADVLK